MKTVITCEELLEDITEKDYNEFYAEKAEYSAKNQPLTDTNGKSINALELIKSGFETLSTKSIEIKNLPQK